MHEVVFYAAFVWMTVLLVVSAAAVTRLRSTASRILALDMLTLILVALLVLYADANRTPYYLDAALVLEREGAVEVQQRGVGAARDRLVVEPAGAAAVEEQGAVDVPEHDAHRTSLPATTCGRRRRPHVDRRYLVAAWCSTAARRGSRRRGRCGR